MRGSDLPGRDVLQRQQEAQEQEGQGDLQDILKRDIFDNTITVSTTISQYFKTVQEIKTKCNLAYNNSTCQSVSEAVRSSLLKKSEPYEEGETLVCGTWFKVKKQVFNVNYKYTITAIEGA